jgi:hypothetical protein
MQMVVQNIKFVKLKMVCSIEITYVNVSYT